MSQKFILTQRELHLGHVKETFRVGAVIEHDETRNVLIVDGRKFDDARDMDILKRQAQAHPDAPWIVPYTEEARAFYKGPKAMAAVPQPKSHPGEGMEIVQSDQDMHETIDISHTKVARVNQASREAEKKAAKTEALPIIRGDETPEERQALQRQQGVSAIEARLAELDGKTDPNSIAERGRLKAQLPARMPIVPDDGSHGMVGGSKSMALNAGQAIPSRESIEAKTEEARAKAEARKHQVSTNREAAGIEGPDSDGAAVQVTEVEGLHDVQTPQEAARELVVESTGDEGQMSDVRFGHRCRDCEAAGPEGWSGEASGVGRGC